MSEFTHLDLCSGTGAFSIGFEREDFKTIGFSEIDPFCCRLLEQNWPGIPNYGDIRNVPAVSCTVITAGDPCQPFSVAGLRKGEADDRYLWPAVLAVVERCQPDFFLGENVVGIANMVLSRRIDDLEKCGYQSKAFDIPSCGLGLPSMERHIWLVAARTEIRLPSPGKECLSRQHLAAWRKARNAFERWAPADVAPVIEGRRMLPEPHMLRSSKGVPHWKHRIAAIGNAVPPPIAQVFAKAIRLSLESKT